MIKSLDELGKVFAKLEEKKDAQYKQHALVSHFLLDKLAWRHERLVLSIIIEHTEGGGVTNYDLKDEKLKRLHKARPGVGSWIDHTLGVLEEKGLITTERGQPQRYVLSPAASFLKQWWQGERWREDKLLGLEEWRDRNRRLLSP